MRLVIIVNTILYLNSLNITGSVCCVCKSKVNRKERSRPFLFVCLFVLFYLRKIINRGAFGSVVSVLCLESERGRGSRSGR